MRPRFVWVLLALAALILGVWAGTAWNNQRVAETAVPRNAIVLDKRLKLSDLDQWQLDWAKENGLVFVEAPPEHVHTPAEDLSICVLPLLFIIGVSAAMLYVRDRGARNAGIESRGRGLSVGFPASGAGGERRTLWERREAGAYRRRGQTVVIAAVILILIAAGGAFWAPVLTVLPFRIMLVGFALLAIVPAAFSAPDKSPRSIAYTLVWGPDRSAWPRRGELDTPIRPIPAGSMPRIESALAGMALASGRPAPKIYRIEGAAANAFILRRGSLCVSRGLLDLLSPEEFGAVFAWLLARADEPQVLGSDISAIAQEAAETTDAEALRRFGDPVTMLSAWRKLLAADNRVPGSTRLPAANYLVPPGENAAWRARRIAKLEELAGAMAARQEPRAQLPEAIADTGVGPASVG